jgi:hypothetical protein
MLKLHDNFEFDKQGLLNNYKTNIEKLVIQFEENKDRLTQIIEERDKDFKNIVQANKEDIEKYQYQGDSLIHEIECHKANILASKLLLI